MAFHPLTIGHLNSYHWGMEKEMPKIRVVDNHTGQSLFECSVEESEKAYTFAAQMEEMGLDVIVESPTLTDTLSVSLGLSLEQRAAYLKSMDEEIENHEGSCCFEEKDSSKSIN
jgi:basic membrane lipoprotein Med (substrate-binding protein (PBP1-ABC) superfamily)